MISEIEFAQNFSSTWRLLAPTTDLFVRKLNLLNRRREFPPLKSEIAPGRRAFINEVAFQLFRIEFIKEHLFTGSNETLVKEAVDNARQTVSRIEKVSASTIATPSLDEKSDFIAQSDRLRHFFARIRTNTSPTLTLSPQFPGCGIIDSCVGDVLLGDTLYEIKGGDRNFRSTDVRQLLIYAALSKSSHSHSLRRLALFNPRTGYSFLMGLDDICLEISGTTAEDLLAELIRVVSSGDTSR